MKTFDRRTVLRSTAIAAIGCACCGSLSGTANASGGSGWSYEGATGPAEWGSIGNDYAACSQGSAQSPIDLASPIPAEFRPAALRWQDATDGQVINNGHTIQVNVPNGSAVKLDGTTFELVQFHFHHPSEHLIDGEALAMEAHFVHRSADGALAVLGVLIGEGTKNAALAPIWSAMPQDKAEGAVVPVALKDFVPVDRAQFRYAGSLTTPPCSEIVNWVAFKTPIQASREQIAAFATLFPMNARPVQPLNRRFLLLGG